MGSGRCPRWAEKRPFRSGGASSSHVQGGPEISDVVIRFPIGQLPLAKADLNTYDRDSSATRLQSCRRWRIVTSRRPKENCLCCTHLYTLQPKKIPSCNRVPRSPRYGSKTSVMVPKRTIWNHNRRFGSTAEKTHPSTLLPLGTTLACLGLALGDLMGSLCLACLGLALGDLMGSLCLACLGLALVDVAVVIFIFLSF